MSSADGAPAPQPPLAAASRTLPPAQYDAILLAGFGGPEGQEDVIPYLRNVTRGRGVPDERLEEVAVHYRANAGVSPINQQNRDLKAALESEIARRGLGLPVYWGNRFWAPYFADALRELHAAGHRRVLAVLTTAFSSYSGCRAYREDLATALADTELTGELTIDKVRQYFDHPGFVEPNIEAVRSGLRELAAAGNSAHPHVAFSTHSIPTAAADVTGPRECLPDGTPVATGNAGGWYGEQQREVARLIMDAVADEFPTATWELAYQSRSGEPTVPWLEPDINDALRALGDGVTGVVIAPIGFVSDHMEVVWDLDTEAMETAGELGLPAVRVPTVGIAPAFVAGLVDLIEERTSGAERRAASAYGPWQDVCPADCCLGRSPKPNIAGL